jgi:DNA helicase-2/ATP-dependent DNA helicase PcrA
MDFIAGLNPQQQQAVAHLDGPLLILAGAGSGKTRVVTHRISHLIARHYVPPESILAVTFTNKAAAEMRERIAQLLGPVLPPGRGPMLFTFHSFCVRMLRRDGMPLAEHRPGFTRQFLIYDDDDQLTLLKSLYKQNAIDDKKLPPRNVLAAISDAKNRGDAPEDIARRSRDPNAKWVAALFEQYNDALIRANALDFDDLLLETVRLLKTDATTRASWNRRIQHLMIDEYQDTNRVQYELVQLLSQDRNNVCAVGDEDQSIYSWRGANIRNILDFERDFPGAQIIRLEQNYRSTKNILEAASAVIANNTERIGKWLWTESSDGPPITIYDAWDGENEALWIADQIVQAKRESKTTRFAVLYRTNAQSRLVEEALRRYGLTYNVVGGLSFYQRAEIKDMLAYLKLLLVPTDPVSLVRVINVPARGIGKTTVEQIEQYAVGRSTSMWTAIGEMLDQRLFSNRAEAAVSAFRKLIEDLREKTASTPLNELLHSILERTGYRDMLAEDKSPGVESRIENLDELLNAAAEAAERGEGLAEFLDHAALVADADQVDEKAQISLLTVHNAKGLEFPLVFLAGMEEGLFPHSRSVEKPSMMEEERRLCYVGMTRAERRLSVSFARARRRYGGGPLEPAMPSRFVSEIPRQLCQLEGVGKLDDEGFEEPGEVDLFAERRSVRDSVRHTTNQIRAARTPSAGAAKQRYPGKTYDSVENIAQFFGERGIHARGFTGGSSAAPGDRTPGPGASVVPIASRPVESKPAWGKPKKKRGWEGTTVEHPRYGRGTVLRQEGEGDEAKLTITFPGHGLKKLIARYAGLRINE